MEHTKVNFWNNLKAACSKNARKVIYDSIAYGQLFRSAISDIIHFT